MWIKQHAFKKKGPTIPPLRCVCHSFDSNLVACSYKGGNCILFAAAAQYQQIKALKVDNSEENSQCMFSPNGLFLATISDNGYSVTVFSINDLTVISTIKPLSLISIFSFVNSYILNICTEDQFIKQYYLQDAHLIKKSAKLEGPISQMCISSNGKYSNIISNKAFYITANYDEQFSLKPQFQWNSSEILFILFSNDCNKMIFGGSDGINICNFMGDKTPYQGEDKLKEEMSQLIKKKMEVCKSMACKKYILSPVQEHTPKMIIRDQSLCNFDLIRVSSSLCYILKSRNLRIKNNGNSKPYSKVKCSKY